MSEEGTRGPMFDCTIREDVLQASAPRTRFLSTGWDGGYQNADAAYNISVPNGWDRTDLSVYIDERRTEAGFDDPGPALLTGVDLDHLAGASLGSVTALATVGLSNPASLPLEPDGGEPEERYDDSYPEPGTINLLVGTRRRLDDSGLATLLGVVVEAKTATMHQLTGFTGTTSDAVIVASDPSGEPSTFAGSATEVGDAARAAVREAVSASLQARYADTDIPSSVADADSGIETTRRAEVFDP